MSGGVRTFLLFRCSFRLALVLSTASGCGEEVATSPTPITSTAPKAPSVSPYSLTPVSADDRLLAALADAGVDAAPVVDDQRSREWRDWRQARPEGCVFIDDPESHCHSVEVFLSNFPNGVYAHEAHAILQRAADNSRNLCVHIFHRDVSPAVCADCQACLKTHARECLRPCDAHYFDRNAYKACLDACFHDHHVCEQCGPAVGGSFVSP